MNINKLAQKDAVKWLAAEMFYGEGAGTRRKLVGAEIQEKYDKIPGYYEAFVKAYDGLDKNKFALAAVKERKAIDRKKFISRNVRGLTTGNVRSLTSGVGTAVTVWAVLHQTGLDEPIKAETKKRYKQAKGWVKEKKARRNLQKTVQMNEDGTYRFKA